MGSAMGRPRFGFTLVELLTVLGIVAVLLAVLLPVLAAARAAARSAADLANVRQIGASLLPWMPDVADWWTGPCASSNGERLTNTYQYNWFLGRDGSYPFDFGTDTYTHTPSGRPLDAPASLVDVREPSGTVAFSLNQATSPFGNDYGCDWNTLESSDFDSKLRWRAVYHGGGNLAFADGHARFLVAKEADAAGEGYPACAGGPSHLIYNWSARGLWMYPGMPEDNGGYGDGPAPLPCASAGIAQAGRVQ